MLLEEKKKYEFFDWIKMNCVIYFMKKKKCFVIKIHWSEFTISVDSMNESLRVEVGEPFSLMSRIMIDKRRERWRMEWKWVAHSSYLINFAKFVAAIVAHFPLIV